jgi:outer membrane receptor protein involved in Fe transport
LWIGQGNVLDTNINIGSLSTTGYDINIGYTGLEIGRFGSLAFNMTGTYAVDLITQPAPGIDLNPNPNVFSDKYDCVGFYSSVCGVPTPQWRHRLRTSWQTPWDLDLSFTWRHYGETTGLTGPNNPLPGNRIDRTLSAEDYFDLAANWAVTEKASVTLGINNVLDDNPSLSASVGTTGNGNTYPQTYDALGRYLFLRATIGF